MVPHLGLESGWEARCPVRHLHPDTSVVCSQLFWFLSYAVIFWIVTQTNISAKSILHVNTGSIKVFISTEYGHQ